MDTFLKLPGWFKVRYTVAYLLEQMQSVYLVSLYVYVFWKTQYLFAKVDKHF